MDEGPTYIGPIWINSTQICLNSSIMVVNSSASPPDTSEIFKARVPCPVDPDQMEMSLVHFWNFAFTLMIITAVLGNTAVLWIVIRKFNNVFGQKKT